MEDRLVAIGEASRLLGVTSQTVRVWCKSGKLVCIRTIGGQRRFWLSDISKLLTGGDDDGDEQMDR